MKCADCIYCENDYFAKMTVCNHPDSYHPPRLLCEPSEACENFKGKPKHIDDEVLVKVATKYFDDHNIQGTLEEFIEYCREMNK